MSDITPIFNTALKSKNSPEVVSYTLDLQNIDEFRKEAYRINAHISSLTAYLRSIRQSYLSTTKPPRLSTTTTTSSTTPKWQPLTNLQRDQIDAETKRILRELNAHIRNLADAEQLRQNTQTSLARKKYSKALGALGSWAAGGMQGVMGKSEERMLEEARAATVRIHREGVLWYLRDRLQIVARAQAGMMERRLGREVEMGKSLLGHGSDKFTTVGHAESSSSSATLPQQYPGAANAVRMEEEAEEGEETENWGESLSPEQLQEFEKENKDMIKLHQSTLSKVNTAQQSLLEISNLQSQLVANLTTQSEHISQLQADSEVTVENVGGANRELKRTAERGSAARWVFYASCGLSAALVVWDLLI